ncbi:zona pellucida sperm-binding protein 3-like [Hippoglossus hippoglossus]|uniref:zona pellucida sperm-binding protein 3-like n=1 Tax=Hippoglossus hippoglossus TaxID=8267 RepID=UPI00148D0089|nr:zona pellucida sperm-binding protein 3-like [Hippoglossus hippoglossus]
MWLWSHTAWSTLSVEMWLVGTYVCIFVGQLVSVHSGIINRHDATLSQNFPGFLDDLEPLSFERDFGFSPYDPIFSSWRTRGRDFHMLADLPPILNVPRVQVFCDQSQLTVLVDKRSNGAMLTAEEIQLGDGCSSNRERPNQFVFTYSVDECGTTLAMHNGLVMFVNTIHINLKKPLAPWWQTPSTVQVSCFPKRSYVRPSLSDSVAPSENGRRFNIKVVTSSWTSVTESNVYKRGQVINLQVSAKTTPDQQLFIQSCFVSASPEPRSKPRHAVIMNKGCTAPLGSSHPVIQFVASSRRDVVNLALNTSYLISELYIHCTVIISQQGVTQDSKSCNYNLIQSRWEDLSGDVEVCECCSSMCKDLSVRHHPEDQIRATLSTGPFVIVDKDIEMSSEHVVSEPQKKPSAPVTDSMQSDAAVTGDAIISGASRTRSEVSSPPQGVVMVSQDPAARLTLWLPGQLQDTEDGLTNRLKASDTISNDFPAPQPSNLPMNQIEGQNLNELKGDASLWDLTIPVMVDGWVIPAFEEDSPRQTWSGSSTVFGPDVPQVDIVLLAGVPVNDLNLVPFDQVEDEPAQMQADAAVTPKEGTNDGRPIIHSKLKFSMETDGTQKLSYEEEAVEHEEGKCETRGCGMDRSKRKQEPGQKGLRSAFLDLLRRMGKAE